MPDPDSDPLHSKLSRPFDPNSTTLHEGMGRCLAEIHVELDAREVRDRKRTALRQDSYIKCIDSIVLDLFRARFVWPEYLVGIASGRTTVSEAFKSRYVPRFKTTDGFLQAMDALEGSGQIETSGDYKSPRGGRTVSGG